MTSAIIILATLLVGAIVFIFWLFKVLKNTFEIADGMMDLMQGKMPDNLKEAYDGKYYPAAVIAQVQLNAPYDGRVVDWSLYETKKIVGFTLLTTDSFDEFYTKDELEAALQVPLSELPQETLEMLKEELLKPKLIKNAVVYAVKEGEWLWKPAE